MKHFEATGRTRVLDPPPRLRTLAGSRWPKATPHVWQVRIVHSSFSSRTIPAHLRGQHRRWPCVEVFYDGRLRVLGEEEKDGDDGDDGAGDNPGDRQIQRDSTFDLGAVPVSTGRAARPTREDHRRQTCTDRRC